MFPSIGLIFIRGQLFERSEKCDYADCEQNSGLFECVQMIKQRSNIPNDRMKVLEQPNSEDGYLIFAYKTMEDMCTKNFAAEWKTWTGARLLHQLLPDKYIMKRLSFFKKVSGTTQFSYLLIAKIADLMMDCATALNMLNCIKQKICAFGGMYRIVTFKVNEALCTALNVSEDQHVYAYTTSLKVIYSNNTAFARYPNYMEFRCDDEDLWKTRKDNVLEMNKKTCETQTDPVEKSMARNTLPRIISPIRVTDELFPRSNLINEKVAHIESCLGADEPVTKETPTLPVFPVHPLPASLTGFRKEMKEEETSTFLFPKDGQYSSIESICSQKHDTNLHQKEPIERIIMRLIYGTTDEDNQEAGKNTQRAFRTQPKLPITFEQENVGTTKDTLLQRLKLRYFNSPEYTIEELRSVESD